MSRASGNDGCAAPGVRTRRRKTVIVVIARIVRKKEMVPGMGFEPMTFGFPWKRS